MERNSNDVYSPAQIAVLVEEAGVTKARASVTDTLTLGLLAGAYIAFGAMLFVLVITGSVMGFGLTRWVGGIAFSLGLVMVVIAGAELFTGNNLIVMAWAERRISIAELGRNWVLVYFANFAGALGCAAMVHVAGTFSGSELKATLGGIIAHKHSLGFTELFFRGVLCNVLVCVAVWLSMAAHSVTGKVLAVVFPVSAFVALGFEHSVANMFLFPLAILSAVPDASVAATVANLVPVTLGNISGGGGLVALVYWLVYLRD